MCPVPIQKRVGGFPRDSKHYGGTKPSETFIGNVFDRRVRQKTEIYGIVSTLIIDISGPCSCIVIGLVTRLFRMCCECERTSVLIVMGANRKSDIRDRSRLAEGYSLSSLLWFQCSQVPAQVHLEYSLRSAYRYLVVCCDSQLEVS
jgi:hypothetical protein